MFNPQLPTITMIAGDTCPFSFRAEDVGHAIIDGVNCTAHFSISPYVNESDTPVYSATSTTITNGELAFDVPPSATVDLRGKYVYQLYISNGRQSEIYEGHLIIIANRNKAVIG